MNWTECEKKAFEDMASEVYGRKVEFQPFTGSIEIEAVNTATFDYSLGFIFFGKITTGIPLALSIENVEFIANTPSGSTFMAKLKLESSGFNSDLTVIEHLLFDSIRSGIVSGTDVTLVWNLTGYKGLLK